MSTCQLIARFMYQTDTSLIHKPRMSLCTELIARFMYQTDKDPCQFDTCYHLSTQCLTELIARFMYQTDKDGLCTSLSV